MLSMPRDANWVYRIFDNRDEALNWLERQRETVLPAPKTTGVY
jgi:hypothetical protein